MFLMIFIFKMLLTFEIYFVFAKREDSIDSCGLLAAIKVAWRFAASTKTPVIKFQNDGRVPRIGEGAAPCYDARSGGDEQR